VSNAGFVDPVYAAAVAWNEHEQTLCSTNVIEPKIHFNPTPPPPPPRRDLINNNNHYALTLLNKTDPFDDSFFEHGLVVVNWTFFG
jgi:hypothetical protein